MSDPFLGSDDYSERAHQLYNEGRYDDAISVLRDGLEVYPFAAELHVGLGYARLAREEYIWARVSFEQAHALDGDHEDALAGLGETLLKFNERERALRCFDRILALGFREDHDLILQIGRALFREGLIEPARGYFEIARDAHPDSSEAAACFGYATHRLGEEGTSLQWLRRALELDPGHAEARLYLGNLLYDRGEYDAALYHFERTHPDDHLDELALWRLIELKKSVYRLSGNDPELKPWTNRLSDLANSREPVEQLLAEVAATQPDGTIRDPRQLELFGALVSELHGMRRSGAAELHRVTTPGGLTYTGTWEQIVLQMRRDDRDCTGESMAEYMREVAQRSHAQTGVIIPASDAESFVRGNAAAGRLRIAG
jgi:tetratricopeptide (TPR) repeat protein